MPMGRYGTPSFESRMLALTNDLFEEFEHVPVRLVFAAITGSWTELRRTPDLPLLPEAIVARARTKLLSISTAAPAGVAAAISYDVRSVEERLSSAV